MRLGFMFYLDVLLYVWTCMYTLVSIVNNTIHDNTIQIYTHTHVYTPVGFDGRAGSFDCHTIVSQ